MRLILDCYWCNCLFSGRVVLSANCFNANANEVDFSSAAYSFDCYWGWFFFGSWLLLALSSIWVALLPRASSVCRFHIPSNNLLAQLYNQSKNNLLAPVQLVQKNRLLLYFRCWHLSHQLAQSKSDFGARWTGDGTSLWMTGLIIDWSSVKKNFSVLNIKAWGANNF